MTDKVNDYKIGKESMRSVAQYDPRPTIAKWLTVQLVVQKHLNLR